MKKLCTLFILLISMVWVYAQSPQEMAAAIEKEATENTQLPLLAHELMDVIGPRLVGTPQMKNAHDWAVKTYEKWGISAANEAWGTWRGWERGITHIDMVSPRVVSLSGRQLAWSPGTTSKGITAGLITIPTLADSMAFKKWVPAVKGKFVLVSMPQPTGRPDYNWEEFATPESFEKMKKERDAQEDAWGQK